MDEQQGKCPHCGKAVDQKLLGLCPECMLKAGLASQATVEPEPTERFEPPTVEELGRRFPQLEILDLIGRGGMGAVYKARQKQLDRVVALKILPPDVARGGGFADRFAREARALAAMNHPNIVTLYEFGEAEGLYFFLMEFVDGVNLRQLMAAGKLAPKEALAIVPHVCDALQYAHDRGIVHRDIKPENILISRDGVVKIADFGVARIVGQGNEATERAVVGTPAYMAPEQVERPAEVDHRADIYSLGVVLYQMLTGELPGQRIEPPSRKVQLDVRIDEIVLRALEKEPERRYETAGVLKTVVETLAGGGTAESRSRRLVPQALVTWLPAIIRALLTVAVHLCIVAVIATVMVYVLPAVQHNLRKAGAEFPGWSRVAVKSALLIGRNEEVGWGLLAVDAVICVLLAKRQSRGPLVAWGVAVSLVLLGGTIVLLLGLSVAILRGGPVPAPVTRASLGTAIEREIVAAGGDGLVFFSLARGEVCQAPYPMEMTQQAWIGKPPEGMSFIKITPALKRWAQEQHVDLVFGLEASSWAWQTLQTRIRDGIGDPPEWVKSFDAITPEDALQRLKQPRRNWGPQSDMNEYQDNAYVCHVATTFPYEDRSDAGWRGNAVIFQTRDGRVGAMQLGVVKTAAHRVVRIRYRFLGEGQPDLADPAPSVPPVTVVPMSPPTTMLTERQDTISETPDLKALRKQRLEMAEASVGLVQARFEAGRATAIDLAAAKRDRDVAAAELEGDALKAAQAHVTYADYAAKQRKATFEAGRTGFKEYQDAVADLTRAQAEYEQVKAGKGRDGAAATQPGR